MDVTSGTLVGAYRLDRLLGKGSMGAVWVGEDVHLRRRVAVKVLAPELADDDRFRRRFLLESQLAASLEHLHIVPIYAAGEQDGSLFLAMRLIDGVDLRALLRERHHLGHLRRVQDAGHRRRRGLPEQVNYEWRGVWTNRDTKKSFVVWGNGMWHDIEAVQIGTSTVYRFTVVDAGQQFVIEDMNGRVVSRDRGSIRVDYLWDTLGDGQPGGDPLGDVGVRVNGPHPADAADFPFCEIAARLTAAA